MSDPNGHDFEDVTYEHFLASAVGTFPVFKKAASARHGIGGLILDAVQASYHLAECWELSLWGDPAVIPLCAAARKSSTISQLKTNLGPRRQADFER